MIGVGFIVRDCHLAAYAEAGFPVGITSRTRAAADEVARLRGVPKVFDSVEQLLDNPEIDVIDVAVPPEAQPRVIRRILNHPRRVRGVLAQKPLAMSIEDAREVVPDARPAQRA